MLQWHSHLYQQTKKKNVLEKSKFYFPLSGEKNYHTHALVVMQRLLCTQMLLKRSDITNT